MCPRCNSQEISRSRGRKFADRLMLWMGKHPYRCRECHKRFYIAQHLGERARRENELRQSVKLEQRLNRPENEPVEPHDIAK
jgi:transposase-like protein